jgi:hypothetical protein
MAEFQGLHILTPYPDKLEILNSNL